VVMRPLQLRSIRVRGSWFTSNRSLRNGNTPYYKNSELATSKGIGHKMASTSESGSAGNQLRTLPGKRNFSLKSRNACAGTTRNWL
jgi:hypothetical protein